MGFSFAPVPHLVSVALGVTAGLLCADAGPVPLAGAVGIASVVLLVPGLPGVRLAALAVLLGAASAARAEPPPGGDDLSARLPEGETRVEIVGEVVSSDPPSAEGLALLVEATAWRTGDGWRGGRSRLRTDVLPLPGRSLPEPRPGDRVRAIGHLSPIRPARNPGGYDARAAWERREVRARLVVPDPRGLVVERASEGPLAGVAWLRAACARSFDRAFPTEDAALLRSLVLGDRGPLSVADRVRFRQAGASHILAVSGAHVAMLVGGLLFLLRRARAPPRIAAGIVLVAVIALVPFTGSAPPVVRSAAGCALFLLGRLFDLEPSGGVLLAAVAAGFLVIDPTAGGDPGFRMSFAAAAGLVLLAGRFHRALVPQRPVLPGLSAPKKAYVRGALAVGAAAWLGSTPVAVHDLGQMNWAAVPVGVVAVPLSTVVMVLGGASALAEPVPVAGPALVLATRGAIGLLRWFLDVPVSVGLETFRVVPPGTLWYAAYAVSFTAAAMLGRRGAVAGAGAMALLLAALSTPPPYRPPDHPRVTFLDVGHGQAVLVELPGALPALLDAGSRDRPDPGERIVVPALVTLGVTRLSLASASHGDSDHAGALPAVLEAVPTTTVVVPPSFPPERAPALSEHGESVLFAEDGDVLLSGAWGRLVVLGPRGPPTERTSRNDGCLVLRLESPEGTIVFPGDRESAGVDRLLSDHPDLRADVLVLPHHGHSSRGRDRLLAAARPKVLVASAPRAVEDELPTGARSTAADGALVVDLLPEGPRVRAPWSDAPPAPSACDAPCPHGPLMSDPLHLLVAALALLAVAFAAIRLRWLTRWGSAAAATLGFAAVAAFGWAGLATLLAPFLAATLAGRLPGGFDHGPRSLVQVAANGLGALVGAAVALLGRPDLGAAAFAGGLSALGADTLATEFGTRYGGIPRSILTGRRLEAGASGGVTFVGFLASAAGSALAPATLLAFGVLPLHALLPLCASGFAAGVLDSLLGATLQRKGRCAACGKETESDLHCGLLPAPIPGRLRFLDNDAVNLVNGLFGAALAAWWLAS